jgi:hypothetical protein
MSVKTSICVVMFLAWHGVPAMSAHHYVAPSGKADHAGTEDSPWDLESTWAGKQSIEPGATIFMMPGVYRHPERQWTGGNFVLSLAGQQDAPIHIRR